MTACDDRDATRRAALAAAYAIVTLCLLFAASSALTPLYRSYQAAWNLSDFVLTAIFAVYAAGFLAALLCVGSLSDYVGRRPLILASLVLECGAMLMIATARGPTMLLAARALQGVATGAAASALGALVIDTSGARAALLNAITPMIGTAAGALFSSGVVAGFAASGALIFRLFLAAFGLLVLLTPGVKETGARMPGALASLRPRVMVPGPARGAFWRVNPVNWAVWALAGFYLSLMPSLLQWVTDSRSALLGGLAAGALTLSGATAIFALHRLPPQRIFKLGTTALVAGLILTLAGIASHSLSLLLFGTVVAGSGFGTGYFGGLRTVLPLADSTDRAALLSAIYVQCYLAFSLPVLAVSLLIPHLGLPVSSYVYGTSLIVLGTVSLARSER